MKIRTLLFLLATPLCCFGERNFTMVDLNNGLTTKLLEVGPTSITVSVEWPLDMRPYGDVAQFDLMGKTNIEERGWYYLTTINADQPQGKAIFELLYDYTSWLNFEESLKFGGKVWFAVRVPAETGAIVQVGARGMYEEDDEEDDEAFERAQKEAIEEFYGERKNDEAVAPPPSCLWFYLAILPVIFVIFCFAWRKLRAQN